MDFLRTIMGVVTKAAPIAANLVIPGSGSVVSGIMDSVLEKAEVNPADMSDEEKAEVIAKDPALLAALKKQAMELEGKIAEEKTKNAAQVNDTIKAELINGRWYQRAWRAWNGFLFPVAVLGCYIGLPMWNAYVGKLVFMPEVPWELWVIWGGILGVASHGRNKEKQAAQGGVVQAASGFLGKILKR